MVTTALKEAATDKPAEGGPLATLQGYFHKHRTQLEMALPRHLKPDRMVRLALTSMSQNPKLMECDPRTVFGAVITASQLGLEIGIGGQGYLVPYKKTCTFIPGWQGLVDLVSRAGRANVWTGAVFEGDKFEYMLGDRPHVNHVPMGEDEPEKLTHVYAVGRVNGSDWPVVEVWPMAKVWKHRDRFNKVGRMHYSYDHPEMYARKVVLLQVLKYVPKSIELQNAITVSEAVESGATPVIEGDFVRVDPVTEPAAEQQTSAAVGGEAAAPRASQPAPAAAPEPAAAQGQEAESSNASHPGAHVSTAQSPAAPAQAAAPKKTEPRKAAQQAEQKPAAKGKKPQGTPEQQQSFLKQLEAAPTSGDLLTVAKEANAFNWPPTLFGPLNSTYHRRNEELTKAEEAAQAAEAEQSEGDLLGDAQ